jgi:hypothetical protein
MAQIQIDADELKKFKLFVGTPMFGGMCTGTFTKSTADLTAICTAYSIPLSLYFLFNESLITRARNYIADEFMRSDATHLMWIDADITFNPRDILALMVLTDRNPNYDIIGAAYPKKCIAWEKVVQAVNKGLAEPPKGTPNDLEKYVGDFVFNPAAGQQTININEPAEVREIGTGFMMVPRRTMDKFHDAYFERYKYRPDHIRTAAFDGSRYIMQYFQAEVDPATERYLSEDYWFSQKAHEIGLKTWLCPWMKLQHTGTYIFSGSLADLAAAGANPTADPEEVNKSKK